MRYILYTLVLLATSGVFAQKTIENGMKSEGYTFKLTEEVQFGVDEEDEANFIWPTLNTKLIPGPDGNMFIFDSDGPRVLAFDKDGLFQKQVAGPGNGPGELKFLLNVTQTRNGDIFIMDSDPMAGSVRLNKFNANMTFVNEIPLRELGLQPALANISSDGKHLGGIFAKFEAETNGLLLKTAIVDLEKKKVVTEISETRTPLPDRTRMQDPAMWVDYLAEQIKTLYAFGMVAFGSDGTAYSAVSNKYEISVWTPGAATARLKFKRQYKPIPFDEKAQQAFIDHFYDNFPPQARQLITKQVLRRAFDKANLPPAKAPIVNLIPIEDKGVMVIHHVNMTNRDNTADIFSKDGRYLCKVKLADNALFAYATSNPTPRMVFRNGKAYTIITDENGDNRAVRYAYSITNKNGEDFGGR